MTADRNMLVGNLWGGLESVNVGTTVIASGNVVMRNGVGVGRYGGGSMKTLGNNLVEENTLDTENGSTVVSGK